MRAPCGTSLSATTPRPARVVQTHYPGTWFLDQYASPGVSLSTKDRCSEEECHGRISTSVGLGPGKAGKQEACFWKKSRPAFKSI